MIELANLIKDTSVFGTYSATVDLTEAVPTIPGRDSLTFDVIEFQPRVIEAMWIRKNGGAWELRKVTARAHGFGGERTFTGDTVHFVSWIRDIVDEVAPKQ